MERSFQKAMFDYWSNIVSLKNYSQSLLPSAYKEDQQIGEMGNTVLKEFFDNLGITEIVDEVSKKHSNEFEIGEKEMSAALELFTTDKELDAKMHKEFEKMDKEELAEHAMKFVKDIRKVGISKSNAQLLYRSALVSLVGFFEVLIADLLHLYFSNKPLALSGDDKIISYNELIAFKSIEEAIEQITSQRIDGFLRGSVADWNHFFTKQLKIDLSEEKDIWEDFTETFQRRHIIVHNDGRANMQYFSKVHSEWIKRQNEKIELHHALVISEEYFSKAILNFTTLGLTLCYKTWHKLKKNEQEDNDHGLHAIIYDLLLEDSWTTAERLCNLALKIGSSGESSKLIYTINLWLCIKRQGRWNEIKDTVNRFDHTACHPRYSICVHSLKEDTEAFYKVLPLVVKSEESKDQLIEWPALEEMRKDPKFYQRLDDLYT